MTERFYMVGGTHGVAPAVYPESNAAAVEHGRLVAVIDPEDGEQVDRLVRLFWDHGNDDCDDPTAMREALREFAAPTPPRPDEPTGLGAVIEDKDGRLWANMTDPTCNTHINPWMSVHDPDRWVSWGDIDAVRVHGEGVQPC